ncbi:VWA domain-containing protein [Roseimicrobium sp. ORNL1]|uniref:VWA domain-containing protein n=1 Tax=Roseimicrobium sp. ORNL1 TaxID=2711231 RepID=UPI00197F3561|nr:VWA domain-containing protein [Roseimicrobium sp. ORNL1]
MATKPPDIHTLREQWSAAWPAALEAWSKFTRLRPPLLCLTDREAQAEGLTGSFAMIRLVDQAIVVSLPEVMKSRVHDFALEVLAHEIGHHVLAPANLTDHARMIARMRKGLPTLEMHAPMVANLYTDLLINDRLQRSAGLRMSVVYQMLAEGGSSGEVWKLYLRIYEMLWSLQRGSLGARFQDDVLEGDAQLGARLIRSYANDWMQGAGKFAALLLPHLLKDKISADYFKRWLDTGNAASGGVPDGLSDVEDGEGDIIHPAQDPFLTDFDDDLDEDTEAGSKPPPLPLKATKQNSGQARQPFEYGEILRAAGVNLSDHDIAVRYYREQALPHLVKFPTRSAPESTDPIPEGLETWDFGEPLENLDVFQSIMRSPKLIPGVTTVQRVWGTEVGKAPEKIPIDLDLYVDSSGSMPDPQRFISYLTLAGAIMALSALRVGARVQATLWSGKNQFTTTGGFVRDESAILKVLTGYYGGATQFPIHVLRETYAMRPRDARPAHILHISDEGISTMFEKDEQGGDGWDIAARALAVAKGGGSMVLNLVENWRTVSGWGNSHQMIQQAEAQQGWLVARVSTWEDLVAYAKEFSRKNYGDAPPKMPLRSRAPARASASKRTTPPPLPPT